LQERAKWYNFLGYIDSICVWYYILIIVQYTLETLFWLLTYMTVRRLIAVPAQANISSSYHNHYPIDMIDFRTFYSLEMQAFLPG